jgi:tetrapyrrole methylase family protein/MazG family protein
VEFPQLTSSDQNSDNAEVLKKFGSLIDLIKTLRGKNGCPWDKQQTPDSMSVYLIEEMYELVEAIVHKDDQSICEELGDVLFHIVFIAAIFEEIEKFDLLQAINLITEKMYRRHPHVFGDTKVENAEDVKKQWHHIKQTEKNETLQTSVLDSVPKNLPALIRAYRVSERASRTGFDWDDINGVIAKVEEEWEEFKQEVNASREKKENHLKKSLEFGDVLFTLVNVARFAGIHPETALAESTHKFEKRFKLMENTISGNGERIDRVSRPEMDLLWEQAKKKVQD